MVSDIAVDNDHIPGAGVVGAHLDVVVDYPNAGCVNEDFIRTARAKGISEKYIITKHSLRNALLPIITLFGLYLPFLISGSLIVEVIFAWPGMGRVAYNGIMGRDYPLIIGATFVSSAMVILGNLIADILYAIADPRVRYSK